MTEQQRLLMPYVESRVDSIISEKEQQSVRPLLASRIDILKPIQEDVLTCMRELHHSGKYKGTNILNQPALIKDI